MQQVLVAVLVALALLQLVRPQVGAQETEDNFTNRGKNQPTVLNLDHYLLQLNNKLDTLNFKLETLDTTLSQHKQQMAAELTQLQTSHSTTQSFLEALNSKLEVIKTGLSQHKQKTAAEIAQIQTSHHTTLSSLETASSRLDLLTSTTAQLLTDHRTAELLQGQQTVLERLHNIEEKLGHMPNHSALVCCNNETKQTEYRSCGDANLLGLPSGTYTIRPSGGSPVTVYCDMDNEECGGGAWMRVASYNYSDPSTACPGDWNLITSPIRSCGRSSSSASCASAVFPTNSIEFSSVCGRVTAIQYGSPSTFSSYQVRNQRSIDDYYVDGVSITYGNPRQHVWTFVGYPSDDYNSIQHNLCPCSQPSLSVPSSPPFVGNNYFCDTAAPTCCSAIYYPDDPLWDGQGCGGPSTCCSFNNPPWFSTALPETTSDDIEVRICDNESSSADDTPITNLDLYIQ